MWLTCALAAAVRLLLLRPVVFARVGRIDVDDLSRNGVSMTIASRCHIPSPLSDLI
jgi:hypothetical protein